MRVLMYIIAIGVVIYVWLGNSINIPWSPTPNDTIPRPQNGWIDATRSLGGYRIGSQDAAKLSAFYHAMATVVQNDDGRLIPDISVFKTKYTAIGHGCFGGDLQGRYHGLSDSIDSVLSMAVSLQTKELNDENRKRLADACQAIAWIFSNPNGGFYGF